MINPYNVQTRPAHQSQIDVDLLRPTEVIAFGVWLERAVRDSFNEKLLFAFEKELRLGTNPRVCGLRHVERSLPPRVGSKLLAFRRTDSSSLRIKLRQGKRLHGSVVLLRRR